MIIVEVQRKMDRCRNKKSTSCGEYTGKKTADDVSIYDGTNVLIMNIDFVPIYCGGY